MHQPHEEQATARAEKRIGKELINSRLFQIILGDDDRHCHFSLYPLAFMQLSKTCCFVPTPAKVA
jgi:hypothetical protein